MGCTKEESSEIEKDIFDICSNNSTSETLDVNNPLSNDYLEYTLKCKKVIYNTQHVLKSSNQNGSNSINIKNIARQSDIVMRPGKWREHIQRSELIKQKKNTQAVASTDQFTCGKCFKKETTYYLRQTRGMDEPETVFITCVKCNNKWRQ